ncbi:MAG: hypothetical protein DRI74_09275 [Bacteroidetes bacterium]|nr:MAG: hypothetical protein DRI74_09275 [Bacteroidota bacterium]
MPPEQKLFVWGRVKTNPAPFKYFITFFIPVIVVFSVYAKTLKFDFVWDDIIVLQNSLAGLRDYSIFLGNGLWSYYRPLIGLSYMFDYTVWGNNPMGFHLFNLVLYVLTTLAATILIYRMFSLNEIAALLGGLLFAVLSTHVESVAWVSGRTDIISAFFLFLTILAFIEYLEQSRKIALWLTAIFAIFSMWGKETGVAYIFILPIVGLLKKHKVNLKEFLILFLPLFVYSVMKMGFFWPHIFGKETATSPISSATSTSTSLNFFKALIKVLNALGFYIWRVFWPFNLSLFYKKLSITPIYLILSIVYLAAMLSSAVKKRWKLFFILFWFFVTLLPSLVLCIVNLSATPIADRYLFIPSFSLSIAVASLWNTLSERKIRRAFLFIYAAFLMLHFYASLKRIPDWKDNYAIWESSYYYNPDNPLVAYWYAKSLYENGELGRAEKIAKELLKKSRKRNIVASVCKLLAAIELSKGNMELANRYIDKSIKTLRSASGLFLKTRIFLKKYLSTGDSKWLDSVIIYDEEASSMFPYNMKYRYDLGLAYLEKGEIEKARRELEFIIENDPSGPYTPEALEVLKDIEAGLWEKGTLRN